ncbi:phospholipase A2 inhibitor and Ly6/PLAUR domain-containing protein-like isoform X3 [Dendropsophus ebraccatus]|uniref:phospholipase A2 inhibitor and Ly6/PLAUR domain-containing protein-like isoform X3 n=1 Tax=Dendropsophus ebraccatus TaxID=150705 RepID=UPI00383168F8
MLQHGLLYSYYSSTTWEVKAGASGHTVEQANRELNKKVPKTSYNFNGVVCPCCTSASDWCYTTETIRCTGDENRCILQIVEIPDLGSTVLRGCATQSMCDDGSVSESVDGLSVNMKITCTNGGRGVH